MFGNVCALDETQWPFLSDRHPKAHQVNLSTSLDVIEKMLKGEPIHVEFLHFNDPASKEAVRKLLLELFKYTLRD